MYLKKKRNNREKVKIQKESTDPVHILIIYLSKEDNKKLPKHVYLKYSSIFQHE